MKTLTIFTPAYNRAYCLDRCYKALKRQTNKDFDWLIIDDGSTDNTRELVQSWIDKQDNGFEIRYIYKENGGLHTAYNEAIANMDTELSMCIDSDDFPPDVLFRSVHRLRHASRCHFSDCGPHNMHRSPAVGCFLAG